MCAWVRGSTLRSFRPSAFKVIPLGTMRYVLSSLVTILPAKSAPSVYGRVYETSKRVSPGLTGKSTDQISGFDVLVTGAPIGAPLGAVACTVGLPADSGTKNWSVPVSGLFQAALPSFLYRNVSLMASCPAEGSNRIMCLSTRASPGCFEAL